MTAQEQIIAKYGQPDKNYFGKYCTLWLIETEFPWFPAKKIYINTDFRDKLRVAFVGLVTAGVQEEIETFDGCYVDRKVRASNKKSLHSWAMALDLNGHIEGLGQTTTHWSEQFLSLMVASGIYWGGNFKRRKDPMHFGLYPG